MKKRNKAVTITGDKNRITRNAFASGKNKWESTLKQSSQNKGAIGKTSQNK